MVFIGKNHSNFSPNILETFKSEIMFCFDRLEDKDGEYPTYLNEVLDHPHCHLQSSNLDNLIYLKRNTMRFNLTIEQDIVEPDSFISSNFPECSAYLKIGVYNLMHKYIAQVTGCHFPIIKIFTLIPIQDSNGIFDTGKSLPRKIRDHVKSLVQLHSLLDVIDSQIISQPLSGNMDIFNLYREVLPRKMRHIYEDHYYKMMQYKLKSKMKTLVDVMLQGAKSMQNYSDIASSGEITMPSKSESIMVSNIPLPCIDIPEQVISKRSRGSKIKHKSLCNYLSRGDEFDFSISDITTPELREYNNNRVIKLVAHSASDIITPKLKKINNQVIKQEHATPMGRHNSPFKITKLLLFDSNCSEASSKNRISRAKNQLAESYLNMKQYYLDSGCSNSCAMAYRESLGKIKNMCS